MPAILVAVLGTFALAACNGNAAPVGPATPSPTPTATPPAATPSPPVEPTPTPMPTPDPIETPEPLTPEQEVRDLLVSTALGLSGVEQRADVDAAALQIGEEGETWFAITTGLGVAELLGECAQVVGVYQRRADGGWVEITRRRLESTPNYSNASLVPGVGLPGHAWIAVFGRIEGAGSTFELLRFDGSELSSQLWWYSPTGEAAQLVDLDGDGRPEIVLDASDPSILCPGCRVIDHQEVIHYWAGGFLRAVELSPLGYDSDVSGVVAEAVAQAHAGLWRESASTFSAARGRAPANADVRRMTILVTRIADARLAHAGAPAQPLLTHVLAGEYAAATDLMRRVQPAEVFAPGGPLIAGTAAAPLPEEMGHLLVEHAGRALAYDPGLADAYAIRALGRMLVDPTALPAALADMRRAAELQPDDSYYAVVVDWLRTQTGEDPEPPADEEEPPTDPNGNGENGENGDTDGGNGEG